MNVRNGIDNLAQILQTHPVPPPTAQKGVNSTSQQGPVQDSVSDLDHDKAQLSNAARQVAQSSATSDVRLDKIASIQNAIQAGTYQVPAAAVAEKLVTSMLSQDK